MRTFNKCLSALIALAMLLMGVSFAEAPVTEATDAPILYSHNGRVTMIEGDCADGPIESEIDAAAVIGNILEQLGGSPETELVPWRTITDAFGNRYYTFQQMSGGVTVLGGAVKVITDADGSMLGLTSSIVSDLPEVEILDGITDKEAEQLVIDHYTETNQQAVSVFEGLTDTMILPVDLKLDIDAEEESGSRYVWVVYTDNPESSLSTSSDLPYLAHYVTLTGEYLYSLPTIMPGDEAASSGFDASYIFEFMEPVDYTGYVDLSTGGEMELTVTVMRDRRTGMYYLGNIERKIVVADCWEYLYNDSHVVVASSPDNMEWDQVGLLSLYNYCRAYDYYKAIGWTGADGEDTPILILNDYCDMEHTPVDNAAYVGKYAGWQIFLSSQCNDYAQCLDVLGHEFTHCVTASVMTYNAYANDFGAINEAMSDIQGKTCQLLMEGGDDATWEIADRSTAAMRSLEEPHRYHQPAFTWDQYYVPGVKTPTTLNDRGGVHTNSSLLNYLAWWLYERAGMTLEEGRAFWFTVDCSMVPGTDYPQLAELLPMALKNAGLDPYAEELQRALDFIRLNTNTLPDTFDEDRALLTLTLPDTGVFADEQWVMFLYTVNTDKVLEVIGEVVTPLLTGDFSTLPESIQAMLDPEAESAEDFDLSTIFEEGQVWLAEHVSDVLFSSSTNGGQDGLTMQIVSTPGYCLPVLMHGVYNDDTSSIDNTMFVIYVGGRWIDVGSIRPGEDVDHDELLSGDNVLLSAIMSAFEDFSSIDSVLSKLFYHIEGGQINVLPGEELVEIEPIEMEDLSMGDEDWDGEEALQNRMSRPKLDEEYVEEEADEVYEAEEIDEEELSAA